MSKRVILVEFIDATNIEARLGVRDDDSTKALLVILTVDLSTNLLGQPTIQRCASTADGTGERCHTLGGLSTHTDVTAQYLQDAYTAFGQGTDGKGSDGQECLYVYLEGVL